MHRLAPILVSLCGSIGIATSLTFFIGIYLSFLPNWQAWKTFFVPNALWFMAIPYIFLMLYMFARGSLGYWLLERGHIEQARRYTVTRMRPNLLRGRREALNNRLVHVMVLVRSGDYLAARSVLSENVPTPKNNRATLSIAVWQLELALRLQDDHTVEALFSEIKNLPKPAPLHAQALACRAELALRQQDREGYEKLIINAFWADPSSKRAQITRALATLTFARDPEQYQEAAALLELVRTQACGDIPLRAAELAALQALAIFSSNSNCNHNEQALKILDIAMHLPADEYATQVLDSVCTLLKSDEL